MERSELERWAADARAREAAGARSRERWLRAQAEEEATLAGVLTRLAERGDTVVVTTVAGRRHRGAVSGVGTDFVALAGPAGTTTLVTLAGLVAARVVDDGVGPRPWAPATGEGGPDGALGVRLADVLAQAAGQRPRVAVQAGAAAIVGDLRSVGADVVTVRPDGGAGLTYVGLASVSEISFLASG